MRTYFTIVTIAMVAILGTTSAQVRTGIYNTDPDTLRLATELFNSTACPEQLITSLGQLIMPSPEKFSFLCGQSYFQGCKDEFVKRCALTDCAATAEKKSYYEKWVDAFSVYGKTYTCNTIGYNQTVDILDKQGGYKCIALNGIKLLQPIAKIVKLMWSGTSFTCQEMETPMEDIITLLSSCENQALKNLITNYLNKVTDQTQCVGSHIGGGTTVTANSAVIFTVLVTSLMVFLRI